MRLENDVLQIEVAPHGAELREFYGKKSGRAYLWNADPAYWNRCSPVLFPFVGGVRDKVYRHEGVSYPMNQHGFARDRDFALLSQGADELWFSLDSDEETRRVYPFDFRLEIGYRLEGNALRVLWKVRNTGEGKMYFSIGAHPAFLCPVREGERQEDCYFLLEDPEGKPMPSFENRIFGQGGVVTEQSETRPLCDGLLPIGEHLFDGDALVLENRQVGKVSLLDSAKKPWLSVAFDAPLVGLWSPPGKRAPFVCIEPWYGRCDSETFAGELKDREWGNTLEAGGEFRAEYTVTIHE